MANNENIDRQSFHYNFLKNIIFRMENFAKNSKLFSDRLKTERISVTQEEVDSVLGKNR
ncbi:MAG: hypothetical protein Q4P83_06590 [Spirochaetales bacterium]|uniref:hypothetical protein n=1 Tax=Treponema berlinense TaxID=225004 RepID=UPI0027022A5D|nr:hypothetical protein [Spirochaetales bacterium]